MKTSPLFLLNVIALVYFLSGITGCYRESTIHNTLNPEDRVALVASASSVSHKYMTTVPEEDRANNLIPEYLWDKTISGYRPIRVEFDRVNVVLVLNENKKFEEGYYIVPLYSSYYPGGDNQSMTLSPLSLPEDGLEGLGLYQYKIHKQPER